MTAARSPVSTMLGVAPAPQTQSGDPPALFGMFQDIPNIINYDSGDGGPSMSIDPESGLPQKGDILDGKFRLDDCVGEGGMGVVYIGENLVLQSRVAVKCLRPSLAADRSLLARFLREARLAASIENEHSTRIYDFGTSETGVPYIVMELLRGESLQSHLSARGTLPVDEVLLVARQVLEVLIEAHGKDLVHRDLKPANLFLQTRADGSLWVKVLDFGISKYLGQDASEDGHTVPSGEVPAAQRQPVTGVTSPHMLLGSPHYMSPEQLRDASSLDQRSDLWSLGVVMFELLTGQMPFDGPTAPVVFSQILNQPAPALRAVRPDVPADLARIVARCLEKDVAQRYASAEALLRELNGLDESLRASILPGPGANARPTVVVHELARPTGWQRYRTMLGVACVVAAGVAAYALAPLVLENARPSNASPITNASAPAREPDPTPWPAVTATTSQTAPSATAASVAADATSTSARPSATAPRAVANSTTGGRRGPMPTATPTSTARTPRDFQPLE